MDEAIMNQNHDEGNEESMDNENEEKAHSSAEMHDESRHVENEADLEIEILSESRVYKQQTEMLTTTSYRNKDSFGSGYDQNRAHSVETVGSSQLINDDESRRRSDRIFSLHLPKGIYVPKKMDFKVQPQVRPVTKRRQQQQPKTIKMDKRQLVLERQLLERERMQIEKERYLLEREKKLVALEKRQAIQLQMHQGPNHHQRGGGMEKTQGNQAKKADRKQTLVMSSYMQHSAHYHGNPMMGGRFAFRSQPQAHEMVYSSNPNNGSPTVRDYLKNHLNIQGAVPGHPPALRIYKQRKQLPASPNIPQSINVSTNHESHKTATSVAMDRLFAKNVPHYVPIPQINTMYERPKMGQNHSDESVHQSFRIHRNPMHLPRSNHVEQLELSDDDDEEDLNNESMGADYSKSDEDDIEVLFDSTSPPPQKIARKTFYLRENRTLTANVTNVQPLDLNGLLEQPNDSKDAAIQPEITNVVPLNLSDFWQNDEKEEKKRKSLCIDRSPSPEIIELDDDEPSTSSLSSQQNKTIIPIISKGEPIDLDAFLRDSSSPEPQVKHNQMNVSNANSYSSRGETIELDKTNESLKSKNNGKEELVKDEQIDGEDNEENGNEDLAKDKDNVQNNVEIPENSSDNQNSPPNAQQNDPHTQSTTPSNNPLSIDLPTDKEDEKSMENEVDDLVPQKSPLEIANLLLRGASIDSNAES